MNQNLKPNDLVYTPSTTSGICKVTSKDGKLFIDDGFLTHHINEQGYRYDFSLNSWVTQPFAFLATPETKEKLEQVYGKLENIPPDLVQEFENALLELCDLCSQNKPSLLGKIGVKQAKLIEMFKNK